MGIHDREYTRQPQRGGGFGRGGGRMLTVTTWLIIVNVGIALLQLTMSQVGRPVAFYKELTVPIESITRLSESRDFLTGPQPAGGADPTRVVGNVLYKQLVDVGPDGLPRPVGRMYYRVMDPLERLGHFSTATGFAQLEVWRLVTFQFLHAGFWHLFFNMFGLWVFGRIVEEQLGGKKYLAFYLVCGIFGGLLYLVLNLAGVLGLKLPGALTVQVTTPLVGASAGVFGVLMACAYIAPKAVVQLLFPPIPIEMRYLAYAFLGLAVWNLVTGKQNAGGEAAHVGGALAGFFFIRRVYLLNDFFDVFQRKSTSAGAKRKPSKTDARSDAEIDRILDKVSRDGLASLTDKEKKALSAASREGKTG